MCQARKIRVVNREIGGRGNRGISAKLFCKRSQVAFMPYNKHPIVNGARWL